ncbi:hypothetical protein C8J55DRAFT_374321, partial [Lentinula edodes]
TFHSLLCPLLVYFNILIRYVFLMAADAHLGPAFAKQTSEYVSSLLRMEAEFQWPYVMEYHASYMNLRRQEMKCGNYLGWGPIDDQLYIR